MILFIPLSCGVTYWRAGHIVVLVLLHPQFLLEDHAEREDGSNIVCTQPRRVAATTLAARVADERNEKCGGTVGTCVCSGSTL